MISILNIQKVYLFQNEDSEHNFHLWVFPRLKWMQKFGKKIESVRPIMEYAKSQMNNNNNNNNNNNTISQVIEYAEKIKEFLVSDQ